jgi:hypothetical protein
MGHDGGRDERMTTRLITTDTRIKYLTFSNPMLFNLPYHPGSL